MLSRLYRKDVLFQMCTDIMRHNSYFNSNNQQIHTINPANSPRTCCYASPHRSLMIVELNKNQISLRCLTKQISTSTRHLSSDLTSEVELTDFKFLSLSDKKVIAKKLFLRPSYLQEIGLFTSKELNKIALSYYFYSNTESLNNHTVYYIESRDQTRNIENCLFEQNFLVNSSFNEIIPNLNGFEHDETSNFLFLPLDKTFIDAINSDVRNDSNMSIIITDDPLDAMSVHQQTKLPTIVLKFLKNNSSSGSILESFCSKINRCYKKIYLWSTDETFMDNFRKLCMKRFDSYKLFLVESSQSAFQLLKEDNKEKFQTLLNSATCLKHPHIVTFDDFKSNLFKKINDPTSNGVQWSRYEKLNEHFKGHRRGELTIITGPTGCGKTTFTSEYSLDLCMQGVPTLWGSFEIKYDYLAEIMLTQFLRKPLNALNEKDYELEASRFSELPLYFINFQGQTDISKVLDSAKHAVMAYGVQHLIIDNLQFVLGLDMDQNANRFFKQDFFIGCLRQFSTKYNCHVTLVAHPRKEKEDVSLSNNSLYGGVKASQEADNIMIIINKFNARFKCNKYVQITKNRYKGSLGVLPLYYDKSSLCFSSNKSELSDTAISSDSETPIKQKQTDKEEEVSDFYEVRYLYQ